MLTNRVVFSIRQLSVLKALSLSQLNDFSKLITKVQLWNRSPWITWSRSFLMIFYDQYFLRNKGNRTARNTFIFNLAVSDLLIACSIPLTMVDGFEMSWVLPKNLILCKFVKTFPCVAAFMSSLTIMAIALDRWPTNYFINQIILNKYESTWSFRWILISILIIYH